MASIREQILVLLQAALNGAGKPAGLFVARERNYPIENGTLPAILFYAEDDAPVPFDKQNYKSPLTVRDLRITVECRAQGHPADSVLDSIIVWATKTIHDNEQFGGLANGIVEGRTAWNLKSGGENAIASATTNFAIKYRTSRTDPTSKG